MPLYEYACAACSHRFDVRQSFTEAPLTICPECGGAIRRVIQPVGIVFKGSGFYKNDSRSSTEASVPAGERKSENGAAPAAPAAPSADGSGSTPAPASPAPSGDSGSSASGTGAASGTPPASTGKASA